MAVACDRLSALPDHILSLILSKLPISHAIRSSVLSKRWRYLYREMPDLNLSILYPEISTATLVNIISDILRLHSSDLKSFSINCPNGDLFTQTVSEWLECIARKNVERLLLNYSNFMKTPSPALFSCTRLTMLTLYAFELFTFPTHFAGFKHLTECNLYFTQMTDDSLARLLLHCPLLHKFHLEECWGMRNPVISARNVTELDIHELAIPGYAVQNRLTVNCPKLKTLKLLFGGTDLTVNGWAFHELSSMIKRLEMEPGSNLCNLSLLSLCSSAYAGHNFSANRFLLLVGKFRSLKVLELQGEKRVAIPLLKLLSTLPTLERLDLYRPMFLEEADGDPIPPSLTYTLPNLQLVVIHLHKFNPREYDAKEFVLLGCLLQIAPALKELKLQGAGEREREQCNSFMEKWESLKKCREQGTLTMKISEIGFYI